MPRTAPVSLLERYTVARCNSGWPQVINLLVAFPAAHDLPSREDLQDSIQALLLAFPSLTCRIRDARTRSAYFEEQEVRDVQDLVLGPDIHLAPGLSTPTELLIRGTQHTTLDDLDSAGPLWRVSRYLPAEGSADLAYLALDTHHAIIDGVGSGKLLEMLLMDVTDLQSRLEPVIKAGPSLAPRLEDVLNLKPSLLHMLRVVWAELVLPKVPGPLRRLISHGRPWPAEEPYPGHLYRKSALRAWVLPADVVSRAKSESKKHGVSTLHPLIHMALACAEWIVVSNKTPDKHRGFRVSATTCISLRKDAAAFPLTTGNFLGTFPYHTTVESSTQLFSATQAYAYTLGSAAARKCSAKQIGMLAYIPDSAKHKPRRSDGKDCTGWESFLLEKAESKYPVTESFLTSNIGRLDLPPCVGDVFFSQELSPFGEALDVMVVGSPIGSVGLSMIWMEGGPIDSRTADKIEIAFCLIFEAVADGRIGRDTTFAQVRQMVSA